MRLMSGLLGLSLLLGSASGCVVHYQARATISADVDTEPPAPREQVRVVDRPGYVFVQGRWEWRANQWQWRDGYWQRARGAGYVWRDGYWEHRNNRYHWIEGHWEAEAKVKAPEPRGDVIVRDHT